MKIKRLIKHNLMRATMTLALIMACATAWAQNPNLADYTFTTGVDASKWITLSGNATQMIGSGQDDFNSDLTDFGFDFTFGNGTYSKFWTSSNGILSFNSIKQTNWDLEFTSGAYQTNQPKICGISADMSTGSNGYVKYEVTGTAPNRILVCEFFLYGNSNTDHEAKFKWQVQLHEANAKVVMVYDNVPNPSPLNSNQIGLSQSESDIWTIDASTHEATHSTGPVESTNDHNIWPGAYRYYEFNPPVPEDFTDNGDDTYTINTATGWNVFCDYLDDINTYNHFIGKTVKLGTNISITQSAGSANHEFMGTFDGDGNTLTVNISETTTQGTAPFREIKGATIQNLVVTGSVNGTIHAAGLVGFARGADANTVNTITNCKVATNVTVTTPSGNNYHCGGVVGHAFHCTLNMSNTVYCGVITSSGNNYVGGLQGWSDGNTINFSHCLFAGTYSGTTTGTALFHPVAVRSNNSATTSDVSHVYYTVTPTLTNSNFIAADGTKTTGRTTAPDNLGSQETTYSFMNMTVYQNGLYYDGLYYVAPTLSTDNSGAYLISSVDDWTNFCDMLYDNATWDRFSGQTVKLDANISVTQSAGSPSHDFCGTFDGQNHTLTFTATATDNYCAPFRYVAGTGETSPAVIQNLYVVTNITAPDFRHAAGLIAVMSNYVEVTNCNVTANISCTKGTTNPNDLYPAGLVSQVASGAQLTVSGCTVSGTISTDGKYAGGMVGIVQGSASITNSVSSVTINSSTAGDGTHGGFVASLISGRHLTIEGCVFNGKIVTTNGTTTNCGGFLGHNNTEAGTGATINNCLYAPTTDPNTVSSGCATFGRNMSGNSITNCYYTQPFGTAQGTQAYSITKGMYVTTLEISGTPTNSYTVSGLDFYSVGLKCGNVLYAAGNDEVSLTLGNAVPADFFAGYSASPTEATLNGSGNPYTLTMPNADVVITVNLDLPPVSYIDENGAPQTCSSYYPLTSTITTLGTADQETWYVVQDTVNYTNTINIVGNTHIILADNAVMNVNVSGLVKYGIRSTGSNNYSLFVYGQTGQSGELNVTSNDHYACVVQGGDITIAGGKVTASGKNRSLYAIKANDNGGNVTIKNATVTVTGSGCGIYAQNGNITIDNSDVTATVTGNNGRAIYAANGNINITGCEVEATGRTGIYATDSNNSGDVGNVTIQNATVTATGSSNVIFARNGNITIDNSDVTATSTGEEGYGIYAKDSGDILLRGGKITANGSYGITCDAGNVTIESGQVEVTGGSYGISANNITLGCTAATDFIKATSTSSLPDSYIGTVKIAEGQTLYVGVNAYTGTLDDAARQAIGGKKLTNVSPIYSYIDLDGIEQTHIAEVIDADNMPTSLSGWYVVQDTVNYTSTINLGGETHIILADNAVMNVTTSGTYYGIQSTSGNNYSLFVYGQTGQSGELKVTSNNFAYYIQGGDITIAGGKVTASGQSRGICAWKANNNGGNVTIKNATVMATGGDNGEAIFAENGNITMTDCEVEATGGSGIFAQRDNDSGDVGNVTIQNATVTATATNGGFAGAIRSRDGNITIDNSDVTATATGNKGSAICAENGNITIDHSDVTATATGNTGRAIYAENGNITITDCEVEATGNSGIYVNVGGNVTIQNATVAATASYAAIRSYKGDITIGNSDVTATSTGFCGIYAENSGDILLNGGKITANGSYGIICDAGDVTIASGQVEVTGGSNGILANNITLGWTTPTDYIYANKYNAGGTLTLTENFIDENGGIYESGTVSASVINGKTLYPEGVVRKQVAGYGEGNGGWVFIASPVAGSIAPSEVHNLLGSYDEATGKYDYDLYRFNQSDANGKEWQNWNATTTENHPDFTSLVNGHGYLYATKETRTLLFAGEYTAATAPVEVPLVYDEGKPLAGWNLVGNPFTVGATSSQPYYRMNEGGTALNTETEDTSVAAMEGVFVQATAANQKVTFTAQTRGGEKRAVAALYIQVGPSTGSGTSVLDNAIIRFDGGQTLEKFSFREGSTKLYIPQDGTDYAIACAESTGEMPVNFKAEENGTYTLTISTTLNSQLSTFNYLHLIDNMTGADVDLLAPNGGDSRPCVSTYTFTAKTTDYESRFKLVFAVGSSTGSDTFAFINNGNIIVNGEGTLQIFDAMGRQLFSKELSTFNSQLSTLNYTPGVYVLRLINGDDVKTQKIVVR